MGNLLNVSCFPGKSNFRVSALSANRPQVEFSFVAATIRLIDKIRRGGSQGVTIPVQMARNKLDLIEAASRRPKNKTIPMTERYRGETKAGPACKQQLGPPCALCCHSTHIPAALGKISG